MRFRGAFILAVIALVAGGLYFSYLLPKSREAALRDEVSRRFFRIDEKSVELIRLRNVNGGFELVREGGQWRLTLPRDLKADEDAVKRIIDVVSGGKIVKVVTSDMGRLSEFGLQTPRVSLLIGYGGTLDELFLADPTPTGADIYAYGRGKKAIFTVGKEVGKVFNAGLYELRKKEVFDFDPGAVERIRVSRKGDTLEFRRSPDGWMINSPMKGRGSAKSVNDFLTGIASQRAEEFYDDAIPDRNKYRDAIKLDLYGSGGAPVSSLEAHYWGTGFNEGVVAYQSGRNYYARTQRDFWNFLKKDFSAFKYRNLFSFAEDEIARVDVKAEGASFSLSRDGSSWLINGKPAEQSAVKNLIWRLKAWEAVRLEQTRDGDVEKEAPGVGIILFDGKAREVGRLNVFDKKEPAGFSVEGSKQANNFYALSSNLETPCYVSSLDIEKVTDRKAFEVKEGK